ncbi:DNA cytosine methyltransferase [Mesorhizobium sp. M0909]|uniref:DNA cytosine methyltransferase n=1 Tax=Mesorhizobium sp. M0909 TaxID=2957024 RepID=UPI00333A3C41
MQVDGRGTDAPGNQQSPVFIDVFAGCGGLSLGLMRAGWRGLFAVEKDAMAFATIDKNLMGNNSRFHFEWPEWLDRKATTIEDLIACNGDNLRALRGKVDLLAGGPPCQGFSSAGRRMRQDPRNAMLKRYLELVELIHPRILVIENVPGITYDFQADQPGEPRRNFANELKAMLEPRYNVQTSFLAAPDFGLPQVRRRFFLVGLAKDASFPREAEVFTMLASSREAFLSARGLTAKTSAADAISDLQVALFGTRPSPDSNGFEAIVAGPPTSPYQRLMKDGHVGPVPDTRLARHSAEIKHRFELITHACSEADRRHVQLSASMRKDFGLKKKATRVMDPSRPSPTITSMPDDLIHYSEPRTLSVRENARLQGFPDWFGFAGKYTTGGDRRKMEVPRFTQVANAVPPLLAEAIGEVLLAIATKQKQRRAAPVLIKQAEPTF